MLMFMFMLPMTAGSLLKYYTSERDVGRRYRGLLSLEVSTHTYRFQGTRASSFSIEKKSTASHGHV